MAEREIIALNESTPQLEAAQSGDTYVAVRATRFAQDIVMSENADHSSTPAAGFGYLWTKNTAPTTLIFTNDDGTDLTLATGGGDLKADGTVPLTANWDVGAFTITGTQFISDIVTGTAPFVVASTTVVANLNCSTLEGNAASAFMKDVVDDATPQLGGNLDGQGNDQTKMGTISMTEQAAANGDVAGDGQIWVKTATPNEIFFTDDAGGDRMLGREIISIKAGDETTAITTGTGKAEFQIVHGVFELEAIYATVTTAPTGSIAIFDVNLNGTTLMTTNKLSIDAGEKTSDTAATAATLTTTTLTENGVITIDFDQVGSSVAGTGPTFYFVGRWTS